MGRAAFIQIHTAINVLSDRNLVRSPQQGYHFSLFLMKTLSTFKLTLVGSMTSYSAVPCGAWDAPTGKVLSHKAFQPFRWPTMTESSPTWVDIKVKIDGRLLIHLELRGYRGDRDMAVQMNYVDDCVMEMLNDIVFIPSVTVIVFQGYRVIANSWEVGGRLYAVSNGGVVVALHYPLCRFELRLVASASGDAVGLDADRLEARFYSAADRVDVSASSVAAPPSWLVASRVSGPTLIKNASWCRQQAAWIECPDQQLQLSQLANIRAHWTAAIDAGAEEETGPRIGAIAVESRPENLRFTCESPLYKAGRHMVEIEALALNLRNKQVKATVAPPILDATSVQPVEIASNALKSLPAPSRRQAALLGRRVLRDRARRGSSSRRRGRQQPDHARPEDSGGKAQPGSQHGYYDAGRLRELGGGRSLELHGGAGAEQDHHRGARGRQRMSQEALALTRQAQKSDFPSFDSGAVRQCWRILLQELYTNQEHATARVKQRVRKAPPADAHDVRSVVLRLTFSFACSCLCASSLAV